MTDFLVRIFIKDHTEIERVSVRTAYGVLASAVGILCNVLLFVVKCSVGYLLHSISVMADAFNNLSDAGSSVIGLVGVKMASKPADRDHPFGHGRIEYIAALIVAFLVMEVGFSFFKDAVAKIREPEVLKFQAVSVVVLVLSVGVKLWLGFFNRKLGQRIDSKVMMATAADAMGDVITTTATIASLLFFWATGVNIDGFVGLGVSLVVMWAGVGIAKDTLEPLIGKAVEPEEYARITDFVEGYEGVLGSHDLIVHNYGPGRSMASIHAEVPNDVEIEASHEVIDRIERDALRMLGVFLVIHMDPVETRDVRVIEAKGQVERILEALDAAVTIHDFRMVSGEEQVNLIFDMEVPYEYDGKKQEELKNTLVKLLKITDSRYQCVITTERSYIGSAKE
ncbi:cation diffusion facilitator family transporter [Lachnospiraceae bacterium 48-21]|jgi:cation diffusion facilitator family transporter|nr:cation transporter [Dorea sp.]